MAGESLAPNLELTEHDADCDSRRELPCSCPRRDAERILEIMRDQLGGMIHKGRQLDAAVMRNVYATSLGRVMDRIAEHLRGTGAKMQANATGPYQLEIARVVAQVLENEAIVVASLRADAQSVFDAIGGGA